MKTRILVATPTFTGGSYMVLEDLLKALLVNAEIKVVGLGRAPHNIPVKFSWFPYFNFEHLNPLFGRNIFFNLLYQIPLQVMVMIQVLFYRPKIIISNGFTPVLLSFPLTKLIGIPLVVYYGSYLDDWIKSKNILSSFRQLYHFVDLAVVNSEGSKEGLSRFYPKERIIVVEHWTDFEAVSENERIKLRHKWGVNDNVFLILFVGRFVVEKGLLTLIEVCKKLPSNVTTNIWFAGTGVLEHEVKDLCSESSQFKHLGFLEERRDIWEAYAIADLLWTYADETYVARPGIESLAVGTPLIIPNQSAVLEKYREKVRIRNDLIPARTGFIVDNDDTMGIANLVTDLSLKKTQIPKREDCVKYAQEHYSRNNILKAVEKINTLI